MRGKRKKGVAHKISILGGESNALRDVLHRVSNKFHSSFGWPCFIQRQILARKLGWYLINPPVETLLNNALDLAEKSMGVGQSTGELVCHHIFVVVF